MSDVVAVAGHKKVAVLDADSDYTMAIANGIVEVLQEGDLLIVHERIVARFAFELERAAAKQQQQRRTPDKTTDAIGLFLFSPPRLSGLL